MKKNYNVLYIAGGIVQEEIFTSDCNINEVALNFPHTKETFCHVLQVEELIKKK